MRKSNTTRMTSKGQVTIPKHLRDKLGVKPGDDIGFREDGPKVILEGYPTVESAAGDLLIETLREFGRKHLIRDALNNQTVDEIMDDLRGYSQDANDPGFQRRS